MQSGRTSGNDGVYYFADWPEHQFLAWLGGVFDGEGCIYMKPGQVGIEVSIVNTDLDVIHSIRKRLGFGDIETLREAGPRNRKQMYWRVRKLHEVRRFLVLVRPYLTIKSTRADSAFVRIAESTRRQQRQQHRREAILALREQGMTHAAIAAHFGTSRTNISQALGRQQPDRSLL